MTKHTQWKYEEGTRTIRTDPGNHWVATMDSWDGALDHEANARLIAVAPELLKELKSILQWMDNELDWKYVPQIENVREGIQQAIAKAER